MLSEIENVKQYEADQHRRWFHDEYFDLYTWETFAGKLLGFQLCYDKNGKQRALRWSPEAGFAHEGIDAPEDKPGRAMSAIFVADGAFDAEIGAGDVRRSSRVSSTPCLGDFGLTISAIRRPPPTPPMIAAMTVPAPAK